MIQRLVLTGALFFGAFSGCLGDTPPPTGSFEDCSAADADPVGIDAVSIDGDELVIDVGYGGGCETHDFEICWPDQAFMESEPVQVSLELWHDAHDDMCDAFLSETLRFDLAPLREAWQSGYQADSGTIVIHLGGETVTYVF